ncbi:MAG: hypothetical protein ACU85V_15410 [Gammaproteobacteria bacterium]
MNATESAPYGAETAAESISDAPDLDPAAEADQNSIRAILEREMARESQDPPAQPDAVAQESEGEPDEAIAADAVPEPPRSWTEAERAAWQGLDPVAQGAILRREQDYQAGLKTDAELRKVLDPVAEALQGSGVHLDQYVRGLLEADRFIAQDPATAVLQMIENNGLRDTILAHLGGKQETAPTRAPEKTSNEVAELKAQLEWQQQFMAAQREWDQFAAQNPEANTLKELIAAKIQASPSLSYADALAQAKELVQGVQGGAAAEAEAARIERGVQRASKARTLNLPRGQSSTPPAPESSGNLSEDLWNAMKKAGLR